MAAAGTGHRQFLVAPGVLDETAIACFSQGQCHALVLALHEATGYPILAARDEAEDIDHLVLALPDGRVLDAAGAHERDAFCAAWGAKLAPIAVCAVNDLPRGGYWREPETALALTMVGPVLEYASGARRSGAPGMWEGPELSLSPRAARVLGPDDRFVSVRAGVIDDEARALYRGRGQSGALAGALRLALGPQRAMLVLVRDEDGEPEHAALRLADGRMLDVDGPASLEEFATRWPGRMGHPRRPSALEDELEDALEPWPAADYAAADLLVDAILEAAGLDRDAR